MTRRYTKEAAYKLGFDCEFYDKTLKISLGRTNGLARKRGQRDAKRLKQRIKHRKLTKKQKEILEQILFGGYIIRDIRDKRKTWIENSGQKVSVSTLRSLVKKGLLRTDYYRTTTGPKYYRVAMFKK